MNISDHIQKMRECVLNDSFFHQIYNRYLSEVSEKGFSLSEQEYAEAHAGLSNILNEQKKYFLDKAEQASRESIKWLAEFGFSRGVFVGFQQYFTENDPNSPFKTLVFEQVMLMPDMQRYPAYYAHREAMLRFYKQCAEGLNKAAQGLVSNIEATWQARFPGVLRHSFYIGYRAALSCVDEVSFIGGSDSIMAKVLQTQHELGLTFSRLEQERYKIQNGFSDF